MAAPDIDKLVARIDPSRLVDSLATMVALPSVNPFDDPASESCREKDFGTLYGDMMADIGLETASRDVVDGRPNVFGTLEGSGKGPTVMLAGHMDTVGVDGYRDPFDPVVRDGKLFGRGSCDMKAGLAAYLEAARVLIESGVQSALVEARLPFADLNYEEVQRRPNRGRFSKLRHFYFPRSVLVRQCVAIGSVLKVSW